MVQEVEKLSPFFFVRDNGAYSRINVDEIAYAKANGAYTIIATLDKKYLISSNLKKVGNTLLDYEHFMRVSRSVIINLSKIQTVQPKSQEIIFPDGSTLSYTFKELIDRVRRLAL